MAMNPRLLRPLASGVHPEAAAWRSAVVANGGSVSASTMRALSNFCADIDGAVIRDRFYRLNPFCGTGLNACLVPLYRGQSRTGTQFGNATDTNAGGLFVAGDYEETGADGGLLGNDSGSVKHLNTGFRTQDFASVSDAHLAVWFRGGTATTTRRAIGAIGSGSDVWIIDVRNSGGNQGRLGGSANVTDLSVIGTDPDPQSIIASRTASNNAALYKNGTSIATQTTNVTGVTGSTQEFGVFTGLQSGTTANGFFPFRLNGYSIGLGMTASQALAFHNAWAAFQTALARGL
jgi:hypothetical protein